MDVECSSLMENTIRCISITSGRMKLILCSFVVLVSTSKPQNMSSKVHLVMELGNDIVDFTEVLSVLTQCSQSYDPRIWAESLTLAELIYKMKGSIAFRFFLAIASMHVLHGKNKSEGVRGF